MATLTGTRGRTGERAACAGRGPCTPYQYTAPPAARIARRATMKKRRRPPRDAAVFPSAPTLVISPSEILRRKTIAANREPGKLPFCRDAFTDSLCGRLVVFTSRFEKGHEARGIDGDY